MTTGISQTDGPPAPLGPEVPTPETAEATESVTDSADIERVSTEVSPSVAGLFADFDDEFRKDLATAHERAAMEAEDLQKEASEMRETASTIEGLAYSETDAFENLDTVVGHVRTASEKYNLPLPPELQRAVSEYQTIREQLHKREEAIGDKNPTAAAELRMKIAKSDVLKGIFQTLQESSKDVLLKAAEASDEKVREAVLRTKEAKDVLDAYPELSARNEVVPDDVETAKELCYRSVRDSLEKQLAQDFRYHERNQTREELQQQLEEYNGNPWRAHSPGKKVWGKTYNDGIEYKAALQKALEEVGKPSEHKKYAHLIATRVIEDIEARTEEQTLSEKKDTYNELRSKPWDALRYYGRGSFLYHAITNKFGEYDISNNEGDFKKNPYLFADVQSVADKGTFNSILFKLHIRPLETAEGVLYRGADKRDQDIARYEENRRIMEEVEPYTSGVIEKGKERQYSDLRTAVEAMENMRTRFVEQLAHLQKEDEQIIALLDNVIGQQKKIMEQGMEPTKPELLITMFTQLQEAIALRFRSVQGGNKSQESEEKAEG